ncbi:MAG: hypothetical protein V1892_00925 [bacterium]
MRSNQLFWNKEKEEFIIKNYGQLSPKEIAFQLKTTSNKVRCRAAYLRRKGKPVFKYPGINWRDEEMKEKLLADYGSKPTHQVAENFKTSVGAIYQAIRRLNSGFRGNDINYTFEELGELLKKDSNTIRRWKKYGLKISGYAKDSLTYSLSRKSIERKEVPQFSWALISLVDFKKFVKSRPEALNLITLGKETKHLLELTRLKIKWQEKKISCEPCNIYFWAALYNNYPRCPKCGRIVSKWAIAYR